MQSTQPPPQQLLWAETQTPPDETYPALQPVRVQEPEGEQAPVPLLNAAAQSLQEAPQQLFVSAVQEAPLL